MSSVISILLSAAMVIGPVVGYIDQYFLIQRKQSSAGFNSITCAILLFANILRIFFWIGKRFEVTLLLQSIAMIITMLVLLKIVIKYGRANVDVIYSQVRTSFSSNDSSIIEDDLLAEENGIPEHYSIKRSIRMPFWNWNYYRDYIYCLTLFTVIMSIIFLIFKNSMVFIEIIGMISLGIESTLPLPQCISNFRNKSTKGFSILIVASWFLGDSFKLFYFIYTGSPLQFIICGSIQLAIDTLIVIEFIVYRQKKPFEDDNELLESTTFE